MTIKREVNGTEMEFELTYQELTKAYFEKQKMIDTEWVQSLFEEYDLEATGWSEDEFSALVDEYQDQLIYGELLGQAEHHAFERAYERFRDWE